MWTAAPWNKAFMNSTGVKVLMTVNIITPSWDLTHVMDAARVFMPLGFHAATAAAAAVAAA